MQKRRNSETQEALIRSTRALRVPDKRDGRTREVRLEKAAEEHLFNSKVSTQRSNQ